MSETRKLVTVTGLDIDLERWPTLVGRFEFDDGLCFAAFGYCLDMAFMVRFMKVFGVTRFSEINGKSFWMVYDKADPGWGGSVTHGLIRIDPLTKKGGKPFDILQWREEAQAQKVYKNFSELEGR